jgi:ParB family transcriptional regulator, chromosome partitioning protein
MLHDLHHIPLADLTLSKLNVRRHGAKDIDSLAASIAALGVIQPLLVRPTGDTFEIVAGQRRYLAMKRLNGDGAPATDVVPCVVMEAADDASALEASLAENLARLPMDEIDQFEAFATLHKKGLDTAAIATHFAISETVVKRRLAIAGLHPDIRRLYRAGELDAKTLHLLTLATRDRQKAWLALTRDPEQEPPPPWQIKAWLLGGVEISTKAALFDEALYQGGIVSDLFGEERYFTDPDLFWRLQNAAIAAEQERLLKTGWREVQIVAPDQRFQAWDYDTVPKARGGAVYIDVEPDGHVTIHKGLLPRATVSRATSNASDAASPCDAIQTERPEMSAPLTNAVDLIRHSAVRLAVANAPQIALRLALAHMIGGSKLWQLEAERQTPHSEAIAQWRETLPTQADFAALRADAITRLGLDGDALIDHRDSGARTAHVFARLRDWSDADVTALLAIAMADALAMGTGLIDTLGQVLGVDVGARWQPDDLFFELAKSRDAITAMLAEVIGDAAAASYLTETGPKKKAIIRKALSGRCRPKVTAWTPRYMRFPQQGYTARPLSSTSLR